jgi:ribosomal protein L37AE/L43A
MRFTPTCPICRRQDAEPYKSRWVCRGCWTLFTGSQLEWERARDMRESYEAQQQLKGS